MIEGLKAPLLKADLVQNEMAPLLQAQGESVAGNDTIINLFSQQLEEATVEPKLKQNNAEGKVLEKLFASETEAQVEGEMELALPQNKKAGEQKSLFQSTEDFIQNKSKLEVKEKPMLSLVEDQPTELKSKIENNGLVKKFLTEEGQIKPKQELVPNQVKGQDQVIKANMFSLSSMAGESEVKNSETGKKVVTEEKADEGLAKILDFKSHSGVLNENVAVNDVSKTQLVENKNVAKVLDISSLQIPNNATRTEIIEKISDYIQTNQLANKSEVELTVKHQDLGTFQINVQKMKGAGDIKLNILANEQEGFKFFQKFEGELIRNLENAGIKVADFRVTTSQFNMSSSFAQDQSSKDGQGRNQWNESNYREESWQKSSSEDSRKQDSERRRDIWAQYRERFGA